MNNEEIELGSDSEDDNQIANGNNVDGQNNDNMTPAQRKLFELRLKMVCFFLVSFVHRFFINVFAISYFLFLLLILSFFLSYSVFWKNSARKANHQEVIEENKRKHADPREEARLKAAEHKKKEEQLRKEAEEVCFFVFLRSLFEERFQDFFFFFFMSRFVLFFSVYI